MRAEPTLSATRRSGALAGRRRQRTRVRSRAIRVGEHLRNSRDHNQRGHGMGGQGDPTSPARTSHVDQVMKSTIAPTPSIDKSRRKGKFRSMP
jgi:hypothetical protein